MICLNVECCRGGGACCHCREQDFIMMFFTKYTLFNFSQRVYMEKMCNFVYYINGIYGFVSNNKIKMKRNFLIMMFLGGLTCGMYAQEKAMVFRRNNGKTVAVRSSEVDSIMFAKESNLLKKLYWQDVVTLNVDDKVDLTCPANLNLTPYSGEAITLGKENQYGYSVYANNGYSHQSSAAYGKYLFMVKDKLATIYMYNLEQKRNVAVCSMTPHTETTSASSSTVLYHCNQTTFGTVKYDENDPFPLMYISQRGPSSTGRCFITVLRLIPTLNAAGTEYNALKTELVQTIHLPAMSFKNAMGNANFTIDPQTGYCYTYSRNNSSSQSNYQHCRITKFAPVDISNPVVYLNDADILDSYEIFELDGKTNISALNMQGGFIWDDKLYISQGYPSCGFIYMRVVDLQQRKLVTDIDLLGDGFPIEPEGFFKYGNHILMSCNGSPIYEIHFE